MTYFVTGATGFIGRHLVERLLEQRDGEINVLVREGSVEKLEQLMEGWGAHGDTDRVRPVFGDLSQPALGVGDADRERLLTNISGALLWVAVLWTVYVRMRNSDFAFPSVREWYE